MRKILLRFFKKWKSFYKRSTHSFRNQLIIGFVIASVIPVFFLGIMVYVVSYSIAEENILASIHYTNSLVNNAISNRFFQMEKVATSLQPYVYDLVNDEDKSISTQLNDGANLRKYISSLVYNFDFYDIKVYLPPEVLFSNEGLTFFTFQELGEINPYIKEFQNNEIQWALIRNQEPSFLKTGGGSSKPVNFISCFKSVNYVASDEMEYLYFIDVSEREIANYFDSIYYDQGIISFMMDSQGMIISHPDEEKVGSIVESEIRSAVLSADENSLPQKGTKIISSQNGITGWYLVTLVPNEFITLNISILNRIIILGLFFIMIFDVLIVSFMLNKLSYKIRVLSNVIGHLPEKMDFSQPLDLVKLFGKEPAYPDEIDQVIILLKQMSGELSKNIENNIEIMKNAEKLELQLLQAKINPHFLYNILESIKTSQTIGKIDIANEMITKLAKFYRLCLRKGDDLISIHDELEISRLYLDIEKLCRDNSFEYEIECDEGIEEFLIPKFTLQPLLENCVMHALVPSGTKLLISISIRFTEENIIIAISDNGQGINSNILSELEAALHSKNVDVKKFYGISNVNARLTFYSNKESAIEISSIPDVGTTIYIWLQQLI